MTENLGEGPYATIFHYQDTETKVIEVVQELTKGKAPDAPKKVKTGDNTMLIVPMNIGILAVVGIILIRRGKRKGP